MSCVIYSNGERSCWVTTSDIAAFAGFLAKLPEKHPVAIINVKKVL